MPKIRLDVDLDELDDDYEDGEYAGNRRSKNNRNAGLEMDGYALNKGRKYGKRTKKKLTKATGVVQENDNNEDEE